MKLTSFVVGVDQERALRIRSIRDEYLPPEKRPASSLLGVAGLFCPDALIEIEALIEPPTEASDAPVHVHQREETSR